MFRRLPRPLIVSILLVSLGTLTHAWDFQWILQFGDAGREVSAGVLIKDNATYAAGYRVPPGAPSDAYLFKYDSSGLLVWARQFGAPASNFPAPSSDFVNGVIAVGDLIVVAGSTNGALPGQTTAGSRDVFLAAYAENGEPVWTTQFGTAGFDSLGVNGVATDGRAIYVAGETNGTFPGQPPNPAVDTFIAKLDDRGNLLWLRQLGIYGFTGLGIVGVGADARGVALVGSFLAGPEETDPGGAFIRRFSPDGDLQWSQDLVRSDFCTVTFWGVSIHDGVAYVVGQWLDLTFPDPDAACTNPSESPLVGVLRAYDVENGSLKWQRRIKGRTSPGADNFTGAKIVTASDAGVFVAANLTETFPGHWQPTPPQRPECPGLFPGNPNVFPDSLDAYVRRYSLDGDVVWTHQFGGPVFDLVTALSADRRSVAAVGDTSCGIDANHTFGGGSRDVFVTRIDAEPSTTVGQVQLLVGRLETLSDAGNVQEPDFAVLVQSLEAALQALETGSPAAGRDALLAFADQVEALIKAGRLPKSANALKGSARDLAEHL